MLHPLTEFNRYGKKEGQIFAICHDYSKKSHYSSYVYIFPRSPDWFIRRYLVLVLQYSDIVDTRNLFKDKPNPGHALRAE